MPASKIPGHTYTLLLEIRCTVATANLRIGLRRCEIRVRGRQAQVEVDLERAWRHDPVLLPEGKVARWLREKREALN